MTVRGPYDDIDFSPPKDCMKEAKLGLKWHEEGHSGDGLVPATVRWARRIASGQAITPAKARKMRAWLARHEVDKEGEGFRPGEKGFPSPGRVAWALWCGDPGVRWSNKLVKQMDSADEKDKKAMSNDNVIRKFNLTPGDMELRSSKARELEPYGEDETGEEEKPDRDLTTVIASAPTPDRYNDIVEPTWNLERFMSNPVVPFAHDYSIPPVGKVTNLDVVNGLLVAQIEWDTSEENELGQLVASQFRRGFMNAVSVGFAPGEVVPRNKLEEDNPYRGDSGNLYRQPELLEISAVPIPAHSGALAIRAALNSGSSTVTFEESGDTFCVTYAIGSQEVSRESEDIAPKHTEESVLRDVFGTHPLSNLFGQ